ncbi:acyl carrier protein [Agarilytica rhodophyticola]|uniref:acyl carrier protein n=1 Tax=Agarilytica rhodophyticola TaxID=1737490 RepID=UPI000B34629F|nr:acyl carrier protein [Agarilytica rhodophyticola]
MKEKLKAIIAEIKKIDVNNIDDEANLLDDIGLGSLDVVSLMFKIEEEFDMEVDFDSFQYEYLSSLSKLVAYLEGSTPTVVNII